MAVAHRAEYAAAEMVLQLERDVHTVQVPWDELGCRAARRAGYSVTATPQPQAFQRSSPLRPVPNRPSARGASCAGAPMPLPLNIQNCHPVRQGKPILPLAIGAW